VGAIAVRRLQAAILDEIESPNGEHAVGELLTQTVTSLRTFALVVGAVALVGAAVAYRVAGIAVAVVVVFVTGIELIPVLIVSVLLAAYLWALSESRR
jgi:hypothetical protein